MRLEEVGPRQERRAKSATSRASIEDTEATVLA